MTTQQLFEEIEIEHTGVTYYANGYVDYCTTECIGGSYEGYAYEVVYEREISHITITDMWHYDQDTGNAVDMLYADNYREIQRVAEEVISYEFE